MDSYLSRLLAAVPSRELFAPIAAMCLLVVVWSLVRPSMFKDEYQQRLPFRPAARLMFACMAVSVYLMIFSLFYSYPADANPFEKLVPLLGWLRTRSTQTLSISLDAETMAKAMATEMKSRAPYYAIFVHAYLTRLKFFRDVEERIAIWLHGRRHLRADIPDFEKYLMEKPFTPNILQSRQYRAYAEELKLKLTDETLDMVGLFVLEKWQKVTTLLDALQDWAYEPDKALNEADRIELEDLKEAHGRKTQLAINIIRMLSSHTTDLKAILANGDRKSASPSPQASGDLETIVASKVRDIADKTSEMSGDELHKRIIEIQELFDDDYSHLLKRSSSLAARTVMLADRRIAKERFERLKQSGFVFLDDLPRVSVEFMLLFFFMIAVPGFFILSYLSRNAARPSAIAVFTSVMAIAALIGVNVGSHKRNISPSMFAFAGFAASFSFVSVNFADYLLRRAMTWQLPPRPQFWQLVAWSLLPCVVTLFVAIMARRERWEPPQSFQVYPRTWERLVDGLLLSLALFVAFSLIIAIYRIAGWNLPPTLRRPAGTSPPLFPILWPLQFFGVLIGAFVVRNARLIAHRSILKPEYRTPEKTVRRAPIIQETVAATA